MVLVGFESPDHPLDAWADRATELVQDHAGRIGAESWRVTDLGGTSSAGTGTVAASDGGEGASAVWRKSFLRAPYLRDALVRLGVVRETFETAVTWDRLEDLCATVIAASSEALESIGAAAGFVTCRLTHAYPDGAAPYFTIVAPARPGESSSSGRP